MDLENETRVWQAGERINLRQWQKQIMDDYEKGGGYSLKKLIYLLESKEYLEQFGTYTEWVPDPVRRFYRAQGYLEAIKVSCFIKEQKLPVTIPSEAERLSQEIAIEVEKAVLKTINLFQQNENY